MHTTIPLHTTHSCNNFIKVNGALPLSHFYLKNNNKAFFHKRKEKKKSNSKGAHGSFSKKKSGRSLWLSLSSPRESKRKATSHRRGGKTKSRLCPSGRLARATGTTTTTSSSSKQASTERSQLASPPQSPPLLYHLPLCPRPVRHRAHPRARAPTRAAPRIRAAAAEPSQPASHTGQQLRIEQEEGAEEEEGVNPACQPWTDRPRSWRRRSGW